MFGHPGRPPLIHDVSFTVCTGECVGLVGASGAGKTTLARLALGSYFPQNGNVRICGYDTRAQLSLARSCAAYVPQRPYLFSGTMAENVLCGWAPGGLGFDGPRAWNPGPVQPQDLVSPQDALRTGLDRLLAELPQGAATAVGEGGAQLSGGQRQRVALARALLRQSRLLVLDRGRIVE